MKKRRMVNKRNVLMALLALFMVFVLVACGGGNGDENGVENGVENGDEESALEDLPIMTMEEVAENDGRDGARAYVVVEGLVYDFTDSPRWTDGDHNGNQAGQDLTEEILEDSPHGRSVLDRFEPIGRIED